MANAGAMLRPLLSRQAAARVSLRSSSGSGTARRPLVHVPRGFELERHGIPLPPPPAPKANYNIVCLPPGESVMYVSGHLPIMHDGKLITGSLGPDTGGLTVEEGYDAAVYCGLNILATLKKQLGDLDRVEEVIKVSGIVSSHPDFQDQHLVVDGCSDLMCAMFGEPAGQHARSAIGTSALPLDAAVEVEAVFEIRPERGKSTEEETSKKNRPRRKIDASTSRS